MAVSIKTARSITYYIDSIAETLDYGNEAGRGENEAPGAWGGRLAEDLELHGAARVEEMIYMYCGFDPANKVDPTTRDFSNAKPLLQNANVETLEYALLSSRRKQAEMVLNSTKARVADGTLTQEMKDKFDAPYLQTLRDTSDRWKELRAEVKRTDKLRDERRELEKQIQEARADLDHAKANELKKEQRALDMELKNAIGGARPAVDICFSANKMFSMLKESAPTDELRAQLAAAATEASDETMASLQRDYLASRTGKTGDHIKADKAAWIRFDHASSRPTKENPIPDMNSHSHYLTFSPVECVDGQTRAIFTDHVRDNMRPMDAEFNARLAAKLRAMGFHIEYREVGKARTFLIGGMEREQETEFSKRRGEVLLEMQRQLAEKGYANANVAVLATRSVKDNWSLDELRKEWGVLLRKAGVSFDACLKAAGENQEKVEIRTNREIIEDLLDKKSYFSLSEIREEVWAEAIKTGDIEGTRARVEEIVKDADLLTLSEGRRMKLSQLCCGQKLDSSPIFMSRTMAARELALERAYDKLVASPRAEIRNAKKIIEDLEKRKTEELRAQLGAKKVAEMEAKNEKVEFRFRADQKEMIGRMFNSGQVFIAQAFAGTGKTTVMEAAAEVYKENGYSIIGVSNSNKAVVQLANDCKLKKDVNAFTLSKLLLMADASDREEKKYSKAKWPDSLPPLSDKTVIIVDEASMASFTQYERLAKLMERTGCKVAFVGDKKQLPSVGKGRMFKNLVERHSGGKACANIHDDDAGKAFGTLTNITRQREEWAKQATLDFAEGRFAQALEAYDARGLIKNCSSMDEAIERMARDHVADPAPLDKKLMVCSTNRDVQQANRAAREALIEAGIIQRGDKTTVFSNGEAREIEIGKGDRLIFTTKVEDAPGKGKKRAPALASKSELATVLDTRLENDGSITLTVMVDEAKAPIRINTKERQSDGKPVGIDHAFAITIHKSQGISMTAVRMLYTQFMSSALAYVGMSRHKDRCELYTTVEDRERMVKVMSKDMPKVEATDLLNEEEKSALKKALENEAGKADKLKKLRPPTPMEKAASVVEGMWRRLSGQQRIQAKIPTEQDTLRAMVAAWPKETQIDENALRIIEHGPARYKRIPTAAQSYCILAEDAFGQQQEIWGVGLEAALGASGAQAGDTVTIERTGSEIVSVTDGETGAQIQTHRNGWSITKIADGGGVPPAKPKHAEEKIQSGVTLVGFGEAPYKFGKDARDSFYIRVMDSDGKKKEIWGVLLQKAIEQSGIQIGEQITFKRTGSENVSVTDKETGEKIDTRRNEWIIERVQPAAGPSPEPEKAAAQDSAPALPAAKAIARAARDVKSQARRLAEKVRASVYRALTRAGGGLAGAEREDTQRIFLGLKDPANARIVRGSKQARDFEGTFAGIEDGKMISARQAEDGKVEMLAVKLEGNLAIMKEAEPELVEGMIGKSESVSIREKQGKRQAVFSRVASEIAGHVLEKRAEAELREELGRGAGPAPESPKRREAALKPSPRHPPGPAL